jgi:hypothetical protein
MRPDMFFAPKYCDGSRTIHSVPVIQPAEITAYRMLERAQATAAHESLRRAKSFGRPRPDPSSPHDDAQFADKGGV